MKYKRSKRVQELLLEEISKLIQFELKDPRIGFATLTGVNLTDNLKFARVFVSIIGDETQKRDTLEGLQSARGFIRSWLGKNLNLRYVPELNFQLDETAENAQNISRLLNEIHPE
ncbi:MAG: 30S ribosome-binding factor RbfA [Candidatus Nitronauta litoralis]|uniref:Ribosome-binding factor A n=1 Tax=Candidatus Nitronauta litoralis TaxID=2705533 RepID=A0A7T0BXC3_9BACT|nr:MAG: 30S ribosome-binding factor RbfA [Candidatus Nitronauta litoralis]